MGREVKFRDWDTETKEMSYDFLEKNWLRVCIESPYVELMQYTGLKDKHGKEIYEGDITKDEFDRVAYIYWKENEARFAMRYNRQTTEYRMFIGHLKTKVIGNIYENPELLEVKTNVEQGVE